MLVYKGWFKEVHLYFLRPGHTHADIDQLFSNWHILDKTENCDTATEFVDKWMQKAYLTTATRPGDRYITWIYDWKTWFKRSLYPNISHHSKIGAFLFKKNPSG